MYSSRPRATVRRRIGWASLLCWLLVSAGRLRAEEPAGAPSPTLNPWLAAGIWTAAQLVPSPLVVVGPTGLRGGARFQITPLLYSFGVAARPLRSFVIEPVARHTGAVELFLSPEWACCAPRDESSWLARAGARVYLPMVLRGESLSASFGGSYYVAKPRGGAAVELGIYTLSSILGFTLTVAPRLEGREVIGALSLHYY